MAEPAYMRIRHRREFIPGPLTECGEENLWEIHEFSHEISGNEPDNLWAHSQWNTKHKVLKVVLEVGTFLPRLYAVDVGNCEYINRVEIFWRQYSEKQKKNHFYFKHTIYPVKITAITMLMPNVKDKHYEKYNLLVSIEFRYRYIEHLYSEGYLHTKAEWKYFFADESFEPIPEEYLSGRCLSHEALEWEENWRKEQEEEKKQKEPRTITLEYIDIEGNPVSEDSFDFRHNTKDILCRSLVKKGALSSSFDKQMIKSIEIIYNSEQSSV